MNELLTVIVPVYNAEKHIDYCVQSILSQTYDNFELILVNDGSNDNSLEICKEWEKKDKRIHVFDQKNKGAGAARNTGLQHMNGAYVLFIDSDDYVSENYLENLYCAAESGNYDIVQGDFKIVTEKNQNSFEILYQKTDLLEVTKVQALNERIYKVCVWGKIYARHIFDGFRFREGAIYEDDASYYIFVDRADKIGVLHETLYYYYMSENSVMRNEQKDKSMAFLDIYEERMQYFKDRGNQTLLDGTYDRYCLVLMLKISEILVNGNNKKSLEKLIQLFKQYYPRAMKATMVKKVDKIMFSCFRVAPKIVGRMIGKMRNDCRI